MKKLIPKYIYNLQPYQSAGRIGLKGGIQLNANESPWNNTIQCKHNHLNRYPEFQPYKLLQLYSQYSGVSINQILITRGADEGIELLVKAFCNPIHDKVMFFQPTYDMYSVVSNIFNIRVVNIPLFSNFQLNLPEIQKNINDVKLIFFCNPNNPTGNLISKKDIIKIFSIITKNTLIVIDEAYIEYSIKNSFLIALKKSNNLVILRTLSKAFGLASLRCGFVISNINIINILKKVIAPYPIATPVSEIAINALSFKNIERVKNNIIKIKKNKKFLIKNLSFYSFIQFIFKSQTNFLLIKFFQSRKVFEHIISHGIIIRDQSHKSGLKDCLRISVGTMKECRELLTVLSLFKGKKIYNEKKIFIH
ncbi:histidinol-phosphate transaminase [Buchnera aphidicola]|uniref:Histidinol-phosphate aminotransferase n=1 Tax=Buchnera aphidicola (Cinara strobi) TaxID=1921549 RepID=A0A3B1E7P4_9GAMM|nr:histidinol-phosphate transaminase [Buchnera aphidicola]VAX76307.1 Histidinol-phosphate aminotransferase [Buchnera aphidicola (Cinara strobi)]